MSTMLNLINPSLEEALEHHGVKGMRWGVRTRNYPSGRTIHTARKNVKSGEKSLRAQRKKVRKAPTPQQKGKEVKKLNQMTVNHLNNPDRVTALRLTKGEAAVHGLFISSPSVLASLATREVTARVIDRRQQTGHYTKKAAQQK